LAILVVILAAAYGAAAWLPVSGGTIAGGEDYTLLSDSDGVEVLAYGLNTLAGLYEGVEYVSIGGIAEPACDGAKVFARMELANGDFLYSSGSMTGYSNVTVGTTPLDGNGGYKLYLQDGQPGPLAYPLAEEVVGLKVWLEGPTSP
jgi:hypothetical protein